MFDEHKSQTSLLIIDAYSNQVENKKLRSRRSYISFEFPVSNTLF